MSRTYRLRRLPVLPGAPRKYGNACVFKRFHDRWRLREDWTVLGHHAVDRELEEAPNPIGHVCDHPWVGYGLAAVDRRGVKRRHRKQGERRFRRACKAALRRGTAFPDRRWFVEEWDLT